MSFRARGTADAAFVGLTCVVRCEKGGSRISSAVVTRFYSQRAGDGRGGGAGARDYGVILTYSVTRTLLTLS